VADPVRDLNLDQESFCNYVPANIAVEITVTIKTFEARHPFSDLVVCIADDSVRH
jgi:hypothetical protein